MSHTQADNITTDVKVEVDFTVPELITTNVVMWKYHFNEIKGRDLLPELRLNLKFSDHVIKANDGPFKGSTALIFDLGMYESKELNTVKISPKVLFTNAYIEEVYDSEPLSMGQYSCPLETNSQAKGPRHVSYFCLR